jgi:membrane protein DedA with SNARE-associated domain
MPLHNLMAAILPALFVLLLGFFAGRRHEFEAEASALMLLTTLAMVVALPIGVLCSNYL